MNFHYINRHRHRSRLVVFALSGLLIIACSSAPERSPGEAAFRANCRTCHVLPKPAKYTDDQWPPLVQRYGTRARLTDAQIELITAYLQKANDTE